MLTQQEIEQLPDLDQAVVADFQKKHWITFVILDGKYYRVKGFYAYEISSLDKEVKADIREKNRQDKKLKAFFKKFKTDGRKRVKAIPDNGTGNEGSAKKLLPHTTIGLFGQVETIGSKRGRNAKKARIK